MKKRIVICADGTWNRPEKDLSKDFPTNILKLARAIKPVGSDGAPQQIFYDWGIGSYHDNVTAGATGKGINKNIMDNYRYIVQNYNPGDDIYLFGFSRGSYTVRALCGFINNIGILKRPHAPRAQEAFDHYKRSGKAYSPRGAKSVEFRAYYSHPSRKIKFVGVWDTVGAMGIPISFLGFFDHKDEFYDTKIGSNVEIARHAMAIDERRVDFEPTIWDPKEGMSLKQVWFTGVHTDIGGSYPPDADGTSLADNALDWMLREAKAAGLTSELHIRQNIHQNALATLHKSRTKFYKLKKEFLREIDHGKGKVLIHKSVKARYESDDVDYKPANLKAYIDVNDWRAEDLES